MTPARRILEAARAAAEAQRAAAAAQAELAEALGEVLGEVDPAPPLAKPRRTTAQELADTVPSDRARARALKTARRLGWPLTGGVPGGTR